jgi:hypothetical protein
MVCINGPESSSSAHAAQCDDAPVRSVVVDNDHHRTLGRMLTDTLTNDLDGAV